VANYGQSGPAGAKAAANLDRRGGLSDHIVCNYPPPKNIAIRSKEGTSSNKYRLALRPRERARSRSRANSHHGEDGRRKARRNPSARGAGQRFCCLKIQAFRRTAATYGSNRGGAGDSQGLPNRVKLPPGYKNRGFGWRGMRKPEALITPASCKCLPIHHPHSASSFCNSMFHSGQVGQVLISSMFFHGRPVGGLLRSLFTHTNSSVSSGGGCFFP